MKDGALGIATALIYPPAFYADTEELIELNRVVAEQLFSLRERACQRTRA